jgi:hypothetical protein
VSISIRIFFITKFWLGFWHLSCLPFQQQHKQSCYLHNTTDSNIFTSDAKPSYSWESSWSQLTRITEQHSRDPDHDMWLCTCTFWKEY